MLYRLDGPWRRKKVAHCCLDSSQIFKAMDGLQLLVDITTDNKKLETTHRFIYLGAIVSDEGSKPEVLSRIAQTTAAVTKLKVIWNNKNIAISSNIRLMHSLAMSIFLYACETWTIPACHTIIWTGQDYPTGNSSRRKTKRKRWEDNIKEWIGFEWNIILRKAENCEEWRKLVVKSTVVPQRSARLQDR